MYGNGIKNRIVFKLLEEEIEKCYKEMNYICTMNFLPLVQLQSMDMD